MSQKPNKQLDLFRAPAVALAPIEPARTTENKVWPAAAGRVSVTLTIPATDLPWLQEVIADHLTNAAKLRAGWGMAFTPNLVVEAGEPATAEQVAVTVRATHFEGWSPTPEGAVWWFQHRVRKEATA